MAIYRKGQSEAGLRQHAAEQHVGRMKDFAENYGNLGEAHHARATGFQVGRGASIDQISGPVSGVGIASGVQFTKHLKKR